MICPFEAVTSFKTAFSLKSKYSLNLASATNERVSSEINCVVCMKMQINTPKPINKEERISLKSQQNDHIS